MRISDWSSDVCSSDLLAAPVPSPARYAGRPVYMTDFVVRADAPFRSLEDTFGGRIGYTVDDSQSGCNAPRHHLLRYRTPQRPRLYSASIGPLYTPRKVIDAGSEEHTSELQSLMRISYAVFCLKKKKHNT